MFRLRYDPAVYSIDIGDEFIVVSDIHLGSSKSMGLQHILSYASEKNIEYIVIAGDFFEDKHFKHSFEELKKLYKYVLEKEGLDIFSKIYIVLSRYSHDPIIDGEKMFLRINGVDILLKYGFLKINVGEEKIYITHGDIICPNGFIAHLVNSFYEKIFHRKFFLERKLKEKLGIKDWLIMGHTHIAGIDYSLKITNTGSWKSYLYRCASKSLIHVSINSIKICYLGDGGKHV